MSMEVRAGKEALVDLYHQGEAARGDPQAARLATLLLAELAQMCAGVPGHPCALLAKRLLRHQGELFTSSPP